MKEEINDIVNMEQLEKLLLHPDTVTPEDIEKWLRDKNFCNDYATAMAVRHALISKQETPNAKSEFSQFRRWIIKGGATTDRQKPQKRIVNLIPWLITAAAVIMTIAVMVHSHSLRQSAGQEDIIVYSANSEVNDVTLTIGNDTFNLNTATAATAARLRGLTLTKDKSLDYDTDEKLNTDNKPHSLSTPNGKTFLLTMPDGTRVWLNTESQLKYPGTFTGETRTVELEGEAYFEVAKDEKHPFVINSGKMTTTVLGTTFNLRNYKNESPCITLIKGRVSVNANGKTMTLTPGHSATISPKGKLVVAETDTVAATCWKEGLFYFDNIPLKTIMTELGRWYRMNVVFKHPDHLNDMLHLNIDKSWTVNEVIKDINAISNTKIRIENNSLIIE